MVSQSIKKNTVFNAIKTVSSVIFPLITFPYISRVLLPENVGKINFGSSIIAYFSLLATLGVTTYAIRECSAVRNDKKKLSDVASQIFSINIITTMVSYTALAITLLLFKKLANYRILIVIQSLSIIATTLGADWINSAMEDFKYITIRSIGFQFLSLILMFAFVKKPDDYLIYAVITLVSTAGANIVNIWYRRRYCYIRFTASIEWRRHFTPIMVLFVMILSQTIYNSVDVTMLGLIHGDVEVGIYSTAQKIMNIIAQVIVSIAWVVMPRMSNNFSEKNYDAINNLLKKVFGFFSLLGLPCIVGTIFLSSEIIQIIAGQEYIAAAPVLCVLMVSLVFNLFGNSLIGNIILLPSKKESQYMLICCVSAILNVIFNSFFIPRYGAVAAAGTTVFCYLVSMIMQFMFVDKNIKIHGVIRMLATPIIGCFAIAITCILFDSVSNIWLRVSLKISVSVLLYALVQIVLKNELFMELKCTFSSKIISRNNTQEREGIKED